MLPDTDRTLIRIQSGDALLREDFIRRHRRFVQRCASSVCRRKLHWSNDDELSVALIAFNRAIDGYVPGRASFLHYARTVIRNSLVDHFRTSGAAAVPLETDEGLTGVEWSASWRQHQDDEANQDRAYEVSRLREILAGLGLTLSDLVRSSPAHRDTREQLKQIALAASQNPAIASRLYETGRLPLKEIQVITGVSRKVLDRWRKYLISLLIIATDAELEGLVDYIWGRRRGNNGPDQGHSAGDPARQHNTSD